MYVACSTLCFGKLSLESALNKVRELGFQKVDLTLGALGPHVSLDEVVADLPRLVHRLRSSMLSFAAFRIEPPGINTETDCGATLKAVGRLARALAVPLICAPAAPLGSDLDAEVERLHDWVRALHAEGVMLTLETDSRTLTADPLGAAEMCRRVPSLGLTLDPSHYLISPHATDDVDELYPWVRHVRLRDTGNDPSRFQVRVGQGLIEYGRIVSKLNGYGYKPVLSIDVRDIPDSPFPVEPEVRKLKYLLESLV